METVLYVLTVVCVFAAFGSLLWLSMTGDGRRAIPAVFISLVLGGIFGFAHELVQDDQRDREPHPRHFVP